MSNSTRIEFEDPASTGASDGTTPSLDEASLVPELRRTATVLDTLKYLVDMAHDESNLGCRAMLYQTLWQPFSVQSMFIPVGECDLRAAISYTQSLIEPLNLMIHVLRARVRELPQELGSTNDEELESRNTTDRNVRWDNQSKLQKLCDFGDRTDLIGALVRKIKERHEKQDEVYMLQAELGHRLQRATKNSWPLEDLPR